MSHEYFPLGLQLPLGFYHRALTFFSYFRYYFFCSSCRFLQFFGALSPPSLFLTLVQTSLKEEEIVSLDPELARQVCCFAISSGNPSGTSFPSVMFSLISLHDAPPHTGWNCFNYTLLKNTFRKPLRLLDTLSDLWSFHHFRWILVKLCRISLTMLQLFNLSNPLVIGTLAFMYWINLLRFYF